MDISMKAKREAILGEVALILGTSLRAHDDGKTELGASSFGLASASAETLGSSSSMGIELLGMGQASETTTSTELVKYLSEEVESHISLPSLDLFSGDGLDLSTLANGNWNLVANADSSSSSNHLHYTDEMPNGNDHPIPSMKASVLGLAPSKNTLSNNALGGDTDATTRTESEIQQIQELAATNLERPLTWDRESCAKAPMTLLRSLSISLSSVVDARMRSCTLVLLRHSLEKGDERSRSRLLALLSTGNKVSIRSVTTSFTASSLPLEVESKAVEEQGKVILPLIFDAVFEISVRGKLIKAALRNPGTIQGKNYTCAASYLFIRKLPNYFTCSLGTFLPESAMLKHLEVSFDAKPLVETLIEQARLVVVQAVATATTLPGAGGLNIPAQLQPNSGKIANGNNMFRKAMAHPLQADRDDEDENDEMPSGPTPLQSFASMKLVSKLKSGKSGINKNASNDFLLGKKNRSVTFDSIAIVSGRASPGSSGSDNSQGSKRRKKNPLGVSNLRSSRSFGKPNAELFENSRNATFADFGRAAESKHIPAFTDQANQNSTGQGQSGKMPRNATFSHLSTPSNDGGATKNSAFALRRNGPPSTSLGPAYASSGLNTEAARLEPRHNALLASFASSSGKTFGQSFSNFNDFLN